MAELLQALSQAFAGADIEWRLSGLQQAGRLPVEALAPISHLRARSAGGSSRRSRDRG